METIEQFLKADINEISQVYTGKNRHCRCGCGGEYIATSFMEDPRSEVNDELAIEKLNRAKRLIRDGAEYDIGDNHINIVTSTNRALTFYFDEIKK